MKFVREKVFEILINRNKHLSQLNVSHSEYFNEEYLRDRINPNSRYSFHRSIQRYVLPSAVKAKT